MCPITRIMFRDPVVVVESGHTYERSAVLSHFERDGAKDPITGRDLSSTTVTTNRTVRQIVQAWLDRHPDVTPDGWDCRELLEPSEDDVKVLRTWRAMCPKLQERWPEDEQPEHWDGVTMENGRVVELELEDVGLTDAVLTELGQLTSLKVLNLNKNQLTSVPAEIGQLASLTLWLRFTRLTSVPAEIGQLTSLKQLWLQQSADERAGCSSTELTSLELYLGCRADAHTSLKVLNLYNNELTSLPAEIGQLTSLRKLYLHDNRLTSLPAEIGQLTSLVELHLSDNQLTSVPAEIGQLTSLKVLNLGGNQLTSVPAEIGQLAALEQLWLFKNQLTSVPAEIGQLAWLKVLYLDDNQLTSVQSAESCTPAADAERAAVALCVLMDRVIRRTVDE